EETPTPYGAISTYSRNAVPNWPTPTANWRGVRSRGPGPTGCCRTTPWSSSTDCSTRQGEHSDHTGVSPRRGEYLRQTRRGFVRGPRVARRRTKDRARPHDGCAAHRA